MKIKFEKFVKISLAKNKVFKNTSLRDSLKNLSGLKAKTAITKWLLEEDESDYQIQRRRADEKEFESL